MWAITGFPSLLWRAGLGCAVSLLAGVVAGAAPQPSHTNVILITIDTLRADHLESYGYTLGKTPAITDLAQNGILFEKAIVQTPITLPSHATILTGFYPIYHRLQDVVGRLRDEVPTLAEWFQRKGFETAAFVGSSVLAARWGLDRGFDVYQDHFPLAGVRQVDYSRIERPAGEVVSLALKWLEQPRSKPFFLWIHLYDPHDPYTPPPPFDTLFRGNPYDGEIAYVDAMLARFFQALKARKLDQHSLIVLTADHGESLWEHKEEHHAFYIYEVSLRVPLIFRIPEDLSAGRFRPGTRVAAQVRSVDIAPTVMQLVGGKIEKGLQGEGLAGLMSGRRPRRELPAYAETHYPRIHFGWSPLFSYSASGYKFIEAPIPELYDLESDPSESHNLYTARRARANQMKEALHALQRKYAFGEIGSDKSSEELEPETVARLKSLGYIAFSAGSGANSPGRALPDPKLKIDTYNQLNKAVTRSREGDPRRAIEILKKVAREEPEMPLVHFLMGTSYQEMGLHLMASQQFEKTIHYNPDSNVARFSLARSYQKSGLPEKARQVLEELLRLDPRHFAARHLLATLLAKEGNYLEAAEQESKALRIRPSFAEGYNNLGSFYLSLGQTKEAVESYRKAIQYAPRNLMALTNLALAYLKENQYDEAIEQARRAIEVNPRFGLSHYYLGQAYLAKGMRNEARTAFRKALEINPKLHVPQLQ
ncbi:MAG: sulfatase-like hydrolase/transferase [Acidobacteriota bacterium]